MSKCQAGVGEPPIATKAYSSRICREKQREHQIDLRIESPNSQQVFTGRHDQRMGEMHLKLGKVVPSLLAGEFKNPSGRCEGSGAVSVLMNSPDSLHRPTRALQDKAT